ncbi:c-type cytochrome [Aliiruegeria lutimaris]|nr:cytochrome c [Aliiruegeria lutimaris]
MTESGVEVSRANGELVFWAGGCASCHASPGRLSSRAPQLGGGHAIQADQGLFRAPNISPDEQAGIGAWKLQDFDRAMRHGISLDGRAYYPAFPYTSYARMTDRDIVDLFAYLKALPSVDSPSKASRASFPVNQPGAMRTWQTLNLHPAPVMSFETPNAELARGQYLVEGPGHCGTCHTPRNALGGQKLGLWLSGAEMLDGSGYAPNLTPHEDGLAGWSSGEIIETLQPHEGAGFAGMAAIRIDLTHLPSRDLEAIAAYLKALPPVATRD